MTDLATIRTMHRYSEWANERVLGTLEKLTPEQLAKPRDTFAHIVGAERLWLQRWRGESPTSIPEWVPTGDLRKLGEEMRATAEERATRLTALTDADLQRLFRARNLKGDVTWELPLGMMLLHVANHSTYHRGQVATLIRQGGGTPVATDFLIFSTQ